MIRYIVDPAYLCLAPAIVCLLVVKVVLLFCADHLDELVIRCEGVVR